MGSDLSKETQQKKDLMDLEQKYFELEAKKAQSHFDLEDKKAQSRLDLEAKKAESHFALEAKKADMDHQHKIAELIVQTKQSKIQGGKEILVVYLEAVTTIINQNSTAMESVISLMQQLNNDKLSDSLRQSIEGNALRLLNGCMSTQDLLDFAKNEVEKLKLKQDEEFSKLLDVAVSKNIMTKENKQYLLK